jgi:small subunit ribosomal protein S7
MDLNFANKKVLITMASSVLGREISICTKCRGAIAWNRSWKWKLGADPLQSQAQFYSQLPNKLRPQSTSIVLSGSVRRLPTLPLISSSRTYSQFPTTYIKPIYLEDKLQELEESGEKSKLAFVPIYPAHGDEISSVFHDPLVNKFVNHLMKEGDKEKARTLVEQAFTLIKRVQLAKYHKTTDPREKEQIILNPWQIFHNAVNNAGPVLETMSIKRGGGTYQVPVPVKDKRRTFIAMKWILEASADKENKVTFFKKLAYTILDAANDTGRVVKRKQDLHKVCEANRAYAHYRWG